MVWIPAWNRLAIFLINNSDETQIIRITGTTDSLNPFEFENAITLDHLVAPKWT
jgi:hypothetical protein